MGATHGFKNPHDSPSRLQSPLGNKRPMREYGDVLLELQLTFGVFFQPHRHESQKSKVRNLKMGIPNL
jgi:hypothetical protein